MLFTIIFMGSITASLVLIWFLQRKAYNYLTKEGFSPVLPTTRSDGACFLSYCIRLLIKKECAGIVPSAKVLMSLWLFVISHPVIIAFLVLLYIKM
jgi:hypothetical protein